MDIPEEEIEQAIIWEPSLLRIRNIRNLQLLERHKPLEVPKGYIDLLFKNGKHYVILELKRGIIKEKSIVTDQVLRYKKCLMEELKLSGDEVVCVLASPAGFSDEVKTLCKANRVIPKKLDEERILEVLSSRKESNVADIQRKVSKIILERRRLLTLGGNGDSSIDTEIAGVKSWLNTREHVELPKKRMASIFLEISKKAPICAHQVTENTDGQLDYRLNTPEDMWFWLFYTVMDKRSNASTFIRARRILENISLFLPQEIIDHISQEEETTLEKITTELEINEFPLLHDSSLGRLAVARGIVDAAKLMRKYEYDFGKMYQSHFEANHGDSNLTLNSIWMEIQTSIYGVGPRMVAQFIRGMVLKGPWKLPLDDDRFLENSKYNIFFAGPARFSLIEKEKDFVTELGKFADTYLDGNRALISHVLWYVRKKYCGRVKHCDICPMAGYCSYYLKINTVKLHTTNQETLSEWMSEEPTLVSPTDSTIIVKE
jgi:hypothetical protein